jgi:hypothetical protein
MAAAAVRCNSTLINADMAGATSHDTRRYLNYKEPKGRPL